MKTFHRLTWLQWIVIGCWILLVSATTGLIWGYISGGQQRENRQTLANAVDLQAQFDLGSWDLQNGRYNLALQRFEYVVQQDPNFPGAVDKLTETLLLISQSGTPNVVLPSVTPTPTPDTRAVDELFLAAQGQLLTQDWKNLVHTILSIRNIDPLYRASEIDPMLFLALRMSGIQKILDDGDLEGGLYDLALAEQFVPLDSQANIYREWARLYQVGVSFWGVFPDRAVYYFSQLAYAAPYLRDATGIIARDRYRMALIQYGDQLAQNGDWCTALEQYAQAQSLFESSGLQPTLTYANDLCTYGGDTPTPTLVESETPTVTPTPTWTLVFDLTPTLEITLTPTPSQTTPAPSPVETTLTPTPSSTPVPTSISEPTTETP
jgi:tetratricopeptide (TPR) repeat protein